MLAATLKHRITIQKKTDSVDSLGSPVETWSDFKTVKAGVFYGSGAKRYETEQEGNTHSYNTVFLIRFLRNFNYSCRIKYNGETFVILAIEAIERNKGFRIVTERRESDA
jgi:SPP1 family predicted phage head-tail adaptor